MPNAPVLNFNVSRRAHNGQPPLSVQKNIANYLMPPIMHVDGNYDG